MLIQARKQADELAIELAYRPSSALARRRTGELSPLSGEECPRNSTSIFRTGIFLCVLDHPLSLKYSSQDS